jgi:hypothetical protein
MVSRSRMMKVKVFAALSVICVAFLCASTVSASEDYYPLSIGSKKVMVMKIKQRDVSVTRKVEEACVSTEMIKGKKYFKVIKGFPGFPSKNVVFYIRKAKGGIFVIDGRYPDRIEEMLMKFPLTSGTTWTHVTRSGKTFTYRVVGRETVVVGGRKYENCVKVHVRGVTGTGEFEGYSYISPAVGTVKAVKKRKGTASWGMTTELVSFER